MFVVNTYNSPCHILNLLSCFLSFELAVSKNVIPSAPAANKTGILKKGYLQDVGYHNIQQQMSKTLTIFVHQVQQVYTEMCDDSKCHKLSQNSFFNSWFITEIHYP